MAIFYTTKNHIKTTLATHFSSNKPAFFPEN